MKIFFQTYEISHHMCLNHIQADRRECFVRLLWTYLNPHAPQNNLTLQNLRQIGKYIFLLSKLVSKN